MVGAGQTDRQIKTDASTKRMNEIKSKHHLFSYRTMEYSLIQGFSDGPHKLLYLHRENHLFYHTNNRSGQDEYTCYDHLLREDYKSENNHSKCTARVFLNDQKQCRRNRIAHNAHQNHELAFRDLKTLNAVKEKCRLLQEWCPLSATKVSAKELLAVELAK